MVDLSMPVGRTRIQVPIQVGREARKTCPGMSLLLESGPTKHGRMASVTSFTSTIPDKKHSTLTSTPTGTTVTAALLSDKLKMSGNDAENAAQRHLNPSQDQTDPTLFRRKPLVIASLVDLKNLPRLKDMGGTEGLMHSLGTDTNLGLRRVTTRAGMAVVQAPGRLTVAHAGVEDKKHVYGVNQMPSRRSESLLLLMRLALEDKVQVLLSIATTVSLALDLYSNIGTEHELILCNDVINVTCGAPKVDWVEGMAIMIAILIVVIFGSLNDW
ncbi:hypothetical protein FRC12_024657 [Ceratobasidium sp. 428]|nr:hypothetical protein FRC12_024657 [Ceratobasidium sp. 428]